jgi:hypothetical protein
MNASALSRPPRSVALCHSPQWRFLMLEILRILKKRYGCAIHVYVLAEAGVAFYKKHAEPGLVDSVTVRKLISDGAQAPFVGDEAAQAAQARAIERRYGATYNEIMMTDRHIGRGFSLLAPGFPRSRQSESTTYASILASFNADFAFWEGEFDARKIDLMIFPQKIPAVVARARGLPTRNFTRTRIGELFHWSHDGEFIEMPALAARTEATPDPGAPVELKVYGQYEINKRNTVAGFGYGRAVANAARWTLQYLQQRLSGRTSGYTWADTARYHLSIPAQWRELRALKLGTLDDLAKGPYVFFTLQEEPEMSLSWQSPESWPQLAYLWQFARDLPAGVRLAVKEHVYAIGRRPKGFYRHLCDFKNVLLVDPLLPGPDVVRGAAAVATITSTAGFEAAWIGKPVISLSRHSLYNFLDHVWQPDIHPGGLRAVFDEIFRGDFDAKKAAADGARFHKALADLSFDIGSYDMAKPERFEAGWIEAAVRALEESLADGLEKAA